VIFAALIGWWLWQETPDKFTTIGALLISIAGILAMSRKSE
jgi:drug/metabolite transporter (DMT)-like permease